MLLPPLTACIDGLRFCVQDSLQLWYGPEAPYLRSVHDELELGDEGPLGSGENLGLFWNVAVSNVIQPLNSNDLLEQAQGEFVVVPGGFMLTSRDSLEYRTFEDTPFRVAS